MRQRKSNIELLRIVLILFVIILHYMNASMGGALGHVQPRTLNYYLDHLIESLSIIAVNVFIIITGYFSYKKSSVKLSKAVNLFMVMLFWGLVLSFVSVSWLVPQTINLKAIKDIINASIFQWFVVVYIILYLLIPYLNKLIARISRKEYQLLIIVNVIIFYIIGVISKVVIADSGYGIINFVTLYLVGAYIRKYHDTRVPLKYSIFTYLLVVLITTCGSFIAGRAWNYNTIFNLIGSIAFFEIFKSIPMGYNKIINKLASFTFSVYLIEVNQFFNKFLYHTLFHSNHYWNSPLMIVNLVVSVIGIYAICIALDWLRVLLFGKLFNRLANLVKTEIVVKRES